MAEPEDDDYFPDDFDGLDFDGIPGLQAPAASAPEATVSFESVSYAAASPIQSVDSDNVEYMDSSFLAAVDALEARAFSELKDSDALPTGASSVSSSKVVGGPFKSDDVLKTNVVSPKGDLDHFHGNRVPWTEDTSSLYQVPKYSIGFPDLPANRKGKRKADPQGDTDIRGILAGYETELTCPICCDLFVGAQITNPCGHTCCGACGYNWLGRNKYEPTCAICRSRLSTRKPLLPNFSVDNFVHQHLRTLAKSGRPEWQEKGYKTIEWNKRLESWKEQVTVRSATEKAKETARLRQRRTRYYDVGDYSYAAHAAPWPIDESTDDGDALVTRVMPRRGARSRH